MDSHDDGRLEQARDSRLARTPRAGVSAAGLVVPGWDLKPCVEPTAARGSGSGRRNRRIGIAASLGRGANAPATGSRRFSKPTARWGSRQRCPNRGGPHRTPFWRGRRSADTKTSASARSTGCSRQDGHDHAQRGRAATRARAMIARSSAGPGSSGTHSWVEPTALAVLALRREGLGSHARVQEGVRLLRDRAHRHRRLELREQGDLRPRPPSISRNHGAGPAGSGPRTGRAATGRKRHSLPARNVAEREGRGFAGLGPAGAACLGQIARRGRSVVGGLFREPCRTSRRGPAAGYVAAGRGEERQWSSSMPIDDETIAPGSTRPPISEDQAATLLFGAGALAAGGLGAKFIYDSRRMVPAVGGLHRHSRFV